VNPREDPALLRGTANLLGRGHDPFVVALVDRDGGRVAVRGLDRSSDVEIGSVSKGITGLLLHDAVTRGEVTLDTRLGDLLELGDGPIGDVVLGALATHRAGLKRLAPGSRAVRGTWRLMTRGENPYGESLAELLDRVRDVRPSGTRARYSNLGFMLLGHAVAAAAGVRYARLVHGRLAVPLGLSGVSVPGSPQELGPRAVQGRSRRGGVREAWTGEALGPAGGIRATVDDLERLVSALLDGTAPGVSALEPVTTMAGPAVRIGAAWITVVRAEREITWHNGGTGGFRSFVGVDRAAGRGVALVRASTRPPEKAGFALLTEPAHTTA
jgi:CubicO group peptidase (beta-lactamase class C family)